MIGPAGAIIANADDMAHWLQFNLRGGCTPSGECLLSQEGLKELYTEQMATPRSSRLLTRPRYPISDIYVAYGMGWRTNYYRGNRFLQQMEHF